MTKYIMIQDFIAMFRHFCGFSMGTCTDVTVNLFILKIRCSFKMKLNHNWEASSVQMGERCLHCGLLRAVQSTNGHARRARGERSTFCLLLTWMQTLECDILCISFVTTVQSHGFPFCLLLPYLLTLGLLWSQESTCCKACLSSEWTGLWNVEF